MQLCSKEGKKGRKEERKKEGKKERKKERKEEKNENSQGTRNCEESLPRGTRQAWIE